MEAEVRVLPKNSHQSAYDASSLMRIISILIFNAVNNFISLIVLQKSNTKVSQ